MFSKILDCKKETSQQDVNKNNTSSLSPVLKFWASQQHGGKLWTYAHKWLGYQGKLSLISYDGIAVYSSWN